MLLIQFIYCGAQRDELEFHSERNAQVIPIPQSLSIFRTTYKYIYKFMSVILCRNPLSFSFCESHRDPQVRHKCRVRKYQKGHDDSKLREGNGNRGWTTSHKVTLNLKAPTFHRRDPDKQKHTLLLLHWAILNTLLLT